MSAPELAWALALLSLGFGGIGVWFWIPERLPVEKTEEETPVPLLSRFEVRGLKALALNVFPREHTLGCGHCNARALVWIKDRQRHDAWTGVCRRCGSVRLDVVAGITIETE